MIFLFNDYHHRSHTSEKISLYKKRKLIKNKICVRKVAEIQIDVIIWEHFCGSADSPVLVVRCYKRRSVKSF